MCAICLDVAEDPLQHGKCGKLFCKECLERYGVFYYFRYSDSRPLTSTRLTTDANALLSISPCFTLRTSPVALLTGNMFQRK